MLSLDKLNAEIDKATQLERKINNDVVVQIARAAESMIAAREPVVRDFALFASSVTRAEQQIKDMFGTVADKVGPALRQIEHLESFARQTRSYRFDTSEFMQRPAVVTSPALIEFQRQAELPKRTIVRREVRRRIGFTPPTRTE